MISPTSGPQDQFGGQTKRQDPGLPPYDIEALNQPDAMDANTIFLKNYGDTPNMPAIDDFSRANELPDIDFGQFGNESLLYDIDHMQTPDLDPLSPTFYDMHTQISPQQQPPFMTPELSGSVGSATSLGASRMGSSCSVNASASGSMPFNMHFANMPLQTPTQMQAQMQLQHQHQQIQQAHPQVNANSEQGSGQMSGQVHAPLAKRKSLQNIGVEGLGIAESLGRWPQVPSPENMARRAKVTAVTQRGITKKPSKQSLKQRKSRASLNGDAPASGKSVTSPALSLQSSVSSTMSLPTSPQHIQNAAAASAVKQKQIKSGAVALNAGVGQLHPPQPSQVAQELARMTPAAVSQSAGAGPTTPSSFVPKTRGRMWVSPAMRSPLRPGIKENTRMPMPHSPLLSSAAAATALYGTAAPQPDLTRRRAMAAAAAAAAASASSSAPSWQSAQTTHTHAQMLFAPAHTQHMHSPSQPAASQPAQSQPVQPLAPPASAPPAATSTFIPLTSQVQPLTPTADKTGSRVSPSTLLVTAKAASKDSNQNNGAPSPTPAARMQSSSKLVTGASDSSPAKGVWQQHQRALLSLSELSRPVSSPRKSASTSSLRNERRKNPKIIPEMSSSMNQFQVELKPRVSTAAKAQTAKPKRMVSAPISQPMQQQQQQQSIPQPNRMPPQMGQMQSRGQMQAMQGMQGLQGKYEPFNGPPISQQLHILPQRGMPNSMYNDMNASVNQSLDSVDGIDSLDNIHHSMIQNMNHSMNHNMNQSVTNMNHNMEQNMDILMDRMDGMDGIDYSMIIYDTQEWIEPEVTGQRQSLAAQPPPPPLPPLLAQTQIPTTAPATLPGLLEHSKVYPQGEPPQHVWASRPQPQKGGRRQSIPRSRSTSGKQQSQPKTQATPPQPKVAQTVRMQPVRPQSLPIPLQQQSGQPQGQHGSHQCMLQSSPQGLPSRVPENTADPGIEVPIVSPVGAQSIYSVPQSIPESVSETEGAEFDGLPQDIRSDFIAQFLNADWSGQELESEWEFMDALETL